MRHLILAALLVESLFLTGCVVTSEPVRNKPVEQAVEKTPEELLMAIDPAPEKMQKRFDPKIQGGEDSEQGTLQWARRYEELSIRNNNLRETNNELTLENSQLKQQVETIKAELEQTKNDMTEANEFLGQMHLELNKWKTDVLGFRQEIRQSQQVQIEALGKILRVLGAEPVDPSNASENSASDAKELK